VSNELKAIEYLRKNIGDTNIPEGWYENEISDMMQEYADSRPTEPKEDNCTCGAQHGTIDGDQKCTDGCLNNNPEPKTKIAEGQSFNAHWIGEESCRDYQIGNITLRDIPDKFVIRNTKFSGGSLLVKGQVDEFIAKCKIDVSVGDGKISVICDEVNK